MDWIPSTRLVKPLENTPNFLRKTTLLYKGFQSPPCHHSTAVVKLMYTFTNLCHEQNGLELGDETVKIFLNTKGTAGEVDDDIEKFLAYVDGKAAEGEFTKDIAAEVERLKQHNETRVEYMTLMMELKEQRREGYDEGRADGRNEGINKGRIDTILNNVRALIAKKGWSPDEALDILNVSPEDRLVVISRL